MYNLQALPRLPDINKNWQAHIISAAAVFSAAGEIAEEIGRSATTADYAAVCYTHANTCFKASLHIERQSTFSKEHDASFLTRSYQNCITLIEERLQVAPDLAEETGKIVIDLFKDTLYSMDRIYLP